MNRTNSRADCGYTNYVDPTFKNFESCSGSNNTKRINVLYILICNRSTNGDVAINVLISLNIKCKICSCSSCNTNILGCMDTSSGTSPRSTGTSISNCFPLRYWRVILQNIIICKSSDINIIKILDESCTTATNWWQLILNSLYKYLVVFLKLIKSYKILIKWSKWIWIISLWWVLSKRNISLCK